MKISLDDLVSLYEEYKMKHNKKQMEENIEEVCLAIKGKLADVIKRKAENWVLIYYDECGLTKLIDNYSFLPREAPYDGAEKMVIDKLEIEGFCVDTGHHCISGKLFGEHKIRHWISISLPYDRIKQYQLTS